MVAIIQNTQELANLQKTKVKQERFVHTKITFILKRMETIHLVV